MQHFRMNVLQKFLFKAKQILPIPTLIDFSPCEKVRTLFLFLCFFWVLFCVMETLQQPKQLSLAESRRHPVASPNADTKQLGEPEHNTLCLCGLLCTQTSWKTA